MFVCSKGLESKKGEVVKRSTQRLTGRFQLELKNSGFRVSECKERRGGLISGNKLRMGEVRVEVIMAVCTKEFVTVNT